MCDDRRLETLPGGICFRMEDSEEPSRKVTVKVKRKRLLPSGWERAREGWCSEGNTDPVPWDRISPVPPVCIGRSKAGKKREARDKCCSTSRLFLCPLWENSRDYCSHWVISATLYQDRQILVNLIEYWMDVYPGPSVKLWMHFMARVLSRYLFLRDSVINTMWPWRHFSAHV